MEFEQLIRLINVVSDSKLKQFKYEEKGVKISMGKEIKIYSTRAWKNIVFHLKEIMNAL